MSVKEQPVKTALDHIKWVLVVLLVSAAIIGNLYFAESVYLFGVGPIEASVFVRIAGVIVLSVVAAYTAITTVDGQRFYKFSKEAYKEARRVVWPTRLETTQTTMVVVAVVALVAFALMIVDWSLGQLVKLILG